MFEVRNVSLETPQPDKILGEDANITIITLQQQQQQHLGSSATACVKADTTQGRWPTHPHHPTTPTTL